MFDDKFMKQVRKGMGLWLKRIEKVNHDIREKNQSACASSIDIKPIYTPLDIGDSDFEEDVGFPGKFPFTRGCQDTMYRGKTWTMRMFSGFGSAEDTNKRWQFLLREGETGLSTAFDFPTLMGYDSDSQKTMGEVGKCGVAIDTLADLEILTNQIPLDEVTTSMTINPPASVLWAMYIVAAEKQGVSYDKIGGTIQNDPLKEFIAEKTFMCPPEPSVKLTSDTIEFGAKYVPRWNTVSIGGYHMREAGATAVQELAFTLADGTAYVQDVIDRKRLDIDFFANRLSFFFDCHSDFFEEIAKLRAARRMWAKIMRFRFNAKNPRSWHLRFHAQTAGCSLTAQQPYNNIIRTTVQALAGILGGTQSLHTNSLDEVWSLPTEFAATIALRTQQILAEETGVTNTIDPLAGSYFVEALTNEIEEKAWEYIEKIDKLGGMLAAVVKGYPQIEIGNAAHEFQKQIDSKEKIIVGVNKYTTKHPPIPLLRVDEVLRDEQIKRLHAIKRSRDNRAVSHSLNELRNACKKGENVMPYVIEAVRAYASEQEICDVYREIYGEYRDPGYL